MLEQAAKRLPSATLLRLDLLGDWAPLAGQRFEVVASGYVFHEFDDATKVGLLTRLRDDHLTDGGRIVIADIAFETRAELERIRAIGEAWDESESYWVSEEAVPALARIDPAATFYRVSFCAGVFRVQPRRDAAGAAAAEVHGGLCPGIESTAPARGPACTSSSIDRPGPLGAADRPSSYESPSQAPWPGVRPAR